jgi:hypothetical protein
MLLATTFRIGGEKKAYRRTVDMVSKAEERKREVRVALTGYSEVGVGVGVELGVEVELLRPLHAVSSRPSLSAVGDNIQEKKAYRMDGRHG